MHIFVVNTVIHLFCISQVRAEVKLLGRILINGRNRSGKQNLTMMELVTPERFDYLLDTCKDTILNNEHDESQPLTPGNKITILL